MKEWIETPKGNQWAIGDVHGCHVHLRKLIDLIQPNSEDQVIFLGDYIDRGPDSAAVIEQCLALKNKTQTHFLRGNHEAMLLAARKKGQEAVLNQLNRLDGLSLMVEGEVPEKYWEFFEATQYLFETENAWLVHGGVDFNQDHPFEVYEDLLWIREMEIPEAQTKPIVHGHVPTPLHKIKENLGEQSMNLPMDGGAVFKDRFPGMGHLCALNLKDFELVSVTN